MSSDDASRSARRRGRTREALIGAARELIADGRAAAASIQEITERADVGFGSFYNHFASKPELFDVATEAVLDDWADKVNTALADMPDPAARFVSGIRLTGRLATPDRGFAHELLELGLRPLSATTGLAPQGRRDLVDAVEQGRFDVADVDVALELAGGGLLALLHRVLSGGAETRAGSRDPDTAFSILSEQLLRACGMDPAEAREIAYRPLPEIS